MITGSIPSLQLLKNLDIELKKNKEKNKKLWPSIE